MPRTRTAIPLLQMTGLAMAYAAAAWICLSVSFVHGTVSPVWPLTGLAIGSLTLWGLPLWPGIAAGAFVANALFAGDPLPAAAGIALGNTLEAVGGALALRLWGVTGEVARVRDGILIIVVAILAPLPSATGGVLSLTLAGLSPWSEYGWVWLAWWMGDFMGALLIVPLMLAWLGDRAAVLVPARPLEFAGALAMAAVFVSFVFLRPNALAMLGVPYLPLSSFLFPPIVWAVLRLRPRETTMVVVAACAISVGFTVVEAEAGQEIGRLLWLQMVLLCIGGGSLLMAGAMTERSKAQQAAHAHEIRFRTIFEQAAVGISRIGLDDRFLEVNKRLCQMLGYDRSELLGKTFEDITVPSFLGEERQIIDELWDGRRTGYVIDKQYRRKDGTPLWVRITSSLPDRGQSTYRISIVEDISRQKEAMVELQAAHSQLQFALEAAHAGLWEWDIPANAGRWTSECYSLMGLDRNVQPTFEAWLAAVAPEDRDRVSAAIRSAFEGAEPQFSQEFRVRHPDKGLCWLMATGRVSYGEDGRPLRMVGLTIDVTEPKQAEEKALAANRAKSMFLAAASHDLRQPVQAIVLLHAALAGRLAGHPAQPVLAKLGVSLEALQRLLGALLDVSRLDAGVVVPAIQRVPLSDVLRRLRDEYGPRAAERGLTLRSVDTSVWTRTDPVLLERILRNLIENALRYTERGGILLGCRRRGDTLRIDVIDTGIGIPHEHQEVVFQEFYQIGNAERDREKGLGLGLSIVGRLCALMGHRVSLLSEPGRGTCFMVHLPSDLPEPKVEPVVAASEAAEPAFSIMVVDDDPLVRLGLTQVLEDWGCEVMAAADASEAVDQLSGAGRCPAALLADYRLPGGRTGVEAAREIRRACGRDIPTIIITGDTAPERIAEAKASGLSLMHKPVQADQLRRMIEALRPRNPTGVPDGNRAGPCGFPSRA